MLATVRNSGNGDSRASGYSVGTPVTEHKYTLGGGQVSERRWVNISSLLNRANLAEEDLKAPVTGQGCLRKVRRSVGHPLGRRHGERGGSEGKEVEEAERKTDRRTSGRRSCRRLGEVGYSSIFFFGFLWVFGQELILVFSNMQLKSLLNFSPLINNSEALPVVWVQGILFPRVFALNNHHLDPPPPAPPKHPQPPPSPRPRGLHFPNKRRRQSNSYRRMSSSDRMH